MAVLPYSSGIMQCWLLATTASAGNPQHQLFETGWSLPSAVITKPLIPLSSTGCGLDLEPLSLPVPIGGGVTEVD